jgi:hypothetical protein
LEGRAEQALNDAGENPPDDGDDDQIEQVEEQSHHNS